MIYGNHYQAAQKNSRGVTNFDDFDFPLFNQSIRQGHYVGVSQVFYIYGEIGDSMEYVDLIHALDTATPDQEIHIRIATPGGNVDGMISILHAIGRTQAKVITHADSKVQSAGTFLFLAGHELCLYPHSNFMFHHCSTGCNYNKNGDNLKHLSFIEEQMSELYQRYYSHFFTQEEIESIKEGNDFWLSSQGMEERIQKCAQSFNENVDIEYVNVNEEEEPKPKQKRKARSK